MKLFNKKLASLAIAAMVALTGSMLPQISTNAAQTAKSQEQIIAETAAANAKCVRGDDYKVAPKKTVQLPYSSYTQGTFKSNRPSVATVSSTGLVTGVKTGVAKVTYEYKGYSGSSYKREYCITVTGSNFYGPGEYKVGTSMKAGTYLITYDPEVYTSWGYWSKSKGGKLQTCNIFYNTQILAVKKGEKIELSACYAIPLSKASKKVFSVSSINKSKNGSAKVGYKGFKAGTYKITPQKSGSKNTGCIKISSKADGKYRRTDTTKYIKKSIKIKLKKGKYVYFENCKIKRVK